MELYTKEINYSLNLMKYNMACIKYIDREGLKLVRDSSVGIASHYCLVGPGIEFPRGRAFSHLSRPALGPTQPNVQ
jgi:hypothetical protein